MPPEQADLELDDNGDIRANVPTENDDPVDIEIIDDAPEKDRGRKPLDADPLEEKDEAEQYSEQVQKRIKALTHKAHDERRERERAQRERDEAVKVAKLQWEEAQKLKKQLTFGEASYASEMVKSVEQRLASAKAKYKQAYEAGDPDALAEANEEMAAAVAEKSRVSDWNAQAARNAESALQQQDDAVFMPQKQSTEQQAVTPDERATQWAANNKWYGKDSEMTSLAYGVHEKLIAEGIHPNEDADEYYKRIDDTMRRRFPEYEWGDRKQQRSSPRPNNVVAPVSRTAKGNKVTLTATQVALAERLGITPEQYAREVLRMQKGGN